MLFGDGVNEAEMSIDPKTVPVPLRIGPGLDHVLLLADEANITITGIG